MLKAKRFSTLKNKAAKLLYKFDTTTSQAYQLDCKTTTKRGLDVLKDPILNKGTAFSESERERLHLRGLLPPRVQSMEMQLERNSNYLAQAEILDSEEAKQLQKYRDLGALQDRNEHLFYRLLMDKFEELAPVIYTPTVGVACLKSHTIYRQARGMYFSLKDRGNLASMTYNWPHDVKVIVVTDGSRVLGLGDLGCNGMPIPVGKLALYVAAGGINPATVLPVVLDVGTDNEALRENKLYLGTPSPRISGKEYDDFVDEFMHAVYSRWPGVLVQFEDFKNPHAQNLLVKYRDRFCCFNDDIQSTGAIALAGVLSSLKARGKDAKDLGEERIVCVGAGSAGIGVCDTIVQAMVRLGVAPTLAKAHEKFFLIDQYGLLGEGRDESSLSDLQKPYVKNGMENGMGLLDVIKNVKPTILLGLSGKGSIFTKQVIEEMSAHVAQPVIFPLSNPTRNSECSAQEAYEWSGGRALFASGSPFEDVSLGSETFYPSQCNNYYIFPGVGLGILSCKASTVPDDFFQEAAMVIAEKVDYAESKRLFPKAGDIRNLSVDIAVRVCEVAQELGIAGREPPRGMQWRQFVEGIMWNPQFYNPTVGI